MSQVKHEFGGFWIELKLERLSARDFPARFKKPGLTGSSEFRNRGRIQRMKKPRSEGRGC
jgi:hypothetical protein